MSLKVWLPLDGNLTNNGSAPATITSSNTTTYATGKIGACYVFNNNNSYVSINCSDLYNTFKGGSQPFTICLWAYHLDSTRGVLFGDYGLSGSQSFNLELTVDHTLRFYWGGSPDYTISTVSTSTNVWRHLAVVYTGTKLKFYQNGVLKETKTVTLSTKNKTSGVYYLGRDNRTGSTTALNGRLNDFRVYDTALSDAQIYQISRALIVHLKLDDYQNIADSAGYGYAGKIVGTTTSASGSPRYSAATAMNNKNTTNHIELTKALPTSMTWFSSSFWVYSDLSNQVIFADKAFEFGILNSRAYISTASANGFNLSNYVANAWNHIVAIRYESNYYLYVNGVQSSQIDSTSNRYIHNGDTLWLFNRMYNSSYGSNSKISDFRIYRITLTQDDILDLYHTGMKIGNTNEVLAREFIETSSTTPKLYKTGTFSNYSIDETAFDTNVQFLKTGVIRAQEFIEM